MRVLIIGGAGFLGSAIARRHLAEGGPELQIDIVDDMSTGSRKPFMNDPRVDVFGSDASKIKFLVMNKYDEIWSFASPASPDDFRDWERILQANITPFRYFKDLLHEDGTLYIATSSEAYGKTLAPMEEGNAGCVRTDTVRSVYDECKRLSEGLGWQIAQDKPEARVVALRIFNTYGPDMPDDGRVINTFVKQAKAGEALTVHGSGLQNRSFCYVDDLIEIFWRLREFAPEGFTVVNCGCDEQVTISQAANLVSKLAGGVDIRHTPARPHDPVWRKPELEKLTKIIGVLPNYTHLEEGIKKCL